MPIKEFAVLLLTLSTSFCAYPGVPSKLAKLIHNWAPLVKLAEKEEFRPSSVDYFLGQTKMEGCSSQPKPTRLTVYNLQRCNGNSYLTTKQSISCPSCTDQLCFVVKIRVTCQCTSSIESKTISWISRTGCSFRTIVGSGSALGALSGVVALEDIQHLDTTLETGRK